MTDPRFPLLIMGASTRAAAYSAIRAGYQPICLDAFADVDLDAVAKVQAIEPYPAGVVDALEALPRCPLMYVGAMENYPHLLEQAGQLHFLAGNPPDVVAHVRDPELIRSALRLMHTYLPETRDAKDPPPADGSWMIKPIASAGGRGVAVWDEHAVHSTTLEEPHFYQKRVNGRACSALFVAGRGIGDVRFVGLTLQIMGDAERGAHDYSWCGNIGPLSLPVHTENLVRRLGNQLKSQCGLVGLFGIDLIVDENDVPWLTEVNPRYPASVELLEFATRQLFIPQHLASFAPEQEEVLVPVSDWSPPSVGRVLGKMVLYAKRDFLVGHEFPIAADAPFVFPEVADVPPVGMMIEAGDPICTVFAQADTIEACRTLLLKKADAVEKLFLGEHR